jgi:hypothetical protein
VTTTLQLLALLGLILRICEQCMKLLLSTVLGGLFVKQENKSAIKMLKRVYSSKALPTMDELASKNVVRVCFTKKERQ